MRIDVKVHSKARGYAYRLLKYRNRSEKEIRDKFLKRKFSVEVIDSVIEHLKKSGYINDLNFAREWLDYRLKVPFGLKRIIFELKAKGVEESIINQVVKSTRVNLAQADALLDVASRKLNSINKRAQDKAKIRQKMYGFLFRRGFSSADIVDCLEKLIPF